MAGGTDESNAGGDGNATSSCAPNPCEHGGTCAEDGEDGQGGEGDGFSCTCSGGYEGERCEVPPAVCEPDPCDNQGLCKATASGFACACLPGFQGDLCEVDIDDCAPNPCKNGGTCVDGVDSFVCECSGGYTGETCTEKLLEGIPLLPNATGCNVEALSSNGVVVVGACRVDITNIAYSWKPSSGTKALSDIESGAFAVSGDGTFVVGHVRGPSAPAHGVGWLNGSWHDSYPGLVHDDMTVASRATAVSDDGSFVAGRSESANGSPRAVRWVDREPVLLGTGHGEIYTNAMSGDGKVIVGYAYEPDAAIQWTAADGLVSLPVLDGADRAVAHGISRDGSIIVGECAGLAVRWVSGSPKELGVAGIARAANEAGDVIVGSSGGEAMIWDDVLGPRILSDVLFELGAPLQGWSLTEAMGVSADGRVIAGNGSFEGVERVWIARLPARE